LPVVAADRSFLHRIANAAHSGRHPIIDIAGLGFLKSELLVAAGRQRDIPFRAKFRCRRHDVPRHLVRHQIVSRCDFPPAAFTQEGKVTEMVVRIVQKGIDQQAPVDFQLRRWHADPPGHLGDIHIRHLRIIIDVPLLEQRAGT